MKRYVIGLMSGTSLDGVDAVLVELGGSESLDCNLLSFTNTPFPMALKQRVESCMQPETSKIDQICSLNFELGELFAKAANDIIIKSGIPASDISCIGSHGQTLYHIPSDNNGNIASTLQLGEPAVVAYNTGCTVVSNFRSADMAAGGQGAPLVPYSEWRLFRSETKNRAFVNIGGISNITILPKKCKLENVRAFDMGPGNVIINALTRRFYGKEYDDKGYYASLGNVNHKLLAFMLKHPYFEQAPPKSTGREDFGAEYVKLLIEDNKELSPNDFIATASAFTTESMASQIEKFVDIPLDEIIVSGGGSYNNYLMGAFAKRMFNICVMAGDAFGINADAKEAVAFAILADACMREVHGNIPSVTGAKKPLILGSVTRC